MLVIEPVEFTGQVPVVDSVDATQVGGRATQLSAAKYQPPSTAVPLEQVVSFFQVCVPEKFTGQDLSSERDDGVQVGAGGV